MLSVVYIFIVDVLNKVLFYLYVIVEIKCFMWLIGYLVVGDWKKNWDIIWKYFRESLLKKNIYIIVKVISNFLLLK